jgi:FkbM family methyltransferase
MSIQSKWRGLQALFSFDNWPMLVLERLFDRGTGLVVYRKGDLEILVDHGGGDEAGTRACLTSDMYRRHLRKIPGGRDERVLDLGANGGGFPLLMRAEKRDLATVVCVEMNRPTYLRLLVNLSTNLGPLATGVNAAVTGMPADSELKLETSRGSTGYSLYGQRTDGSNHHEVVRTTTLEALYEQYFNGAAIDICKVDIESAEYDALDATPDAILEKIRNLIIEFHDPARTDACVQRLLRLGFSETTGDGDPRTGENTEVRVFARREAAAQARTA